MEVFGNIVGGITSALVNVALPVLATAIAALVVGIAKRYLTRLGLELTAEQDRRLRELVAEAVAAVEEMARRKDDLKGEDKREQAKALILDRLLSEPDVVVPSAGAVDKAIDAALTRARQAPVPATPATLGR